MKKTIVLGLSLLTLGTAVTPGILSTVVQADENISVSESPKISNDSLNQEVSSVDQYVVVKDNQYELSIPSNASINPELVSQAQELITESNKLITQENLVIDPVTKIATDPTSVFYAYTEGITSVEVHWNYARIFVSKSTANFIQNNTITAASVLAGKIPNVYVEVGAVILLGLVSNLQLKGGFYFDFNYLLGNQGYHWQ